MKGTLHEKLITRTVRRPKAFPAATFLTLSSRNNCTEKQRKRHAFSYFNKQFLNENEKTNMRNYTLFRGRTVRRGSTSATSSAIFMASMDGLRSTGNSSGRVELGRFGFMVSKHMICSKQSFKPSRSNTLTAWVLSEFVKTWNKFKHNLVLVLWFG